MATSTPLGERRAVLARVEGHEPTYDIPPTPEPATPLPAYLAYFLSTVLYYTEEQIAATSREEAQRLLNEHYAAQLREPLA